MSAISKTMSAIGEYSMLRVVKEVDFGVYLDGGSDGEILLPKRYVPETCKVGDDLEVFLYLDSEDKLIATTLHPVACVNEFAYLQVVSVSAVGAFLDWGLAKDLLLPFREQKNKVVEGQKLLVYIFLDKETNRLAASAKLEKFIDNIPPVYAEGDEVDVLIWTETEIGYKAVINHRHGGIFYKNEVFQPLLPGQHVKAYIKKIREDEKIDLTLHKPGVEQIDDSAAKIISYLKEHDGFMPYNDKSASEDIAEIFGISKKVFKKTLGNLYRNRRIEILNDGVKLIENE